MRSPFMLLFALVWLLSGCVAPLEPDRPRGQLVPDELEKCRIAAPGGQASVEARCTTLEVPEDAANPSGRMLTLHLAVLPAISRSPAPDPLLFLTGGPGQAATESFALLAPAFRDMNLQRDIVLVDQRGTGQSNPLRCPAPADANLPDPAAWARDCLTQLDADPRFYTTSEAVADLERVRVAFGYERLNLFGVSYGTRVALSYTQRYPERVRSLILDGVVPQDEALGLDVARDAQRALMLIVADCAADSECAARFPDLLSALQRVLERLRTTPAEVTLVHPRTAERTTLTLTADAAAATIRLLSYAPETAALLPLLIHAADQGDLTVLAAQTLIVSDSILTSISNGMGFSVLCTEDLPLITPELAAAANAGSYLGNQQTEQLAAVCSAWPRGTLPGDFKQPVVGSMPVLLLSGERDPVTPPADAERVAQGFPNSIHLVAPGQGHNVVARGCLPRLVGQFVDELQLSNDERACVQRLRAAPFFLNPAAPMP